MTTASSFRQETELPRRPKLGAFFPMKAAPGFNTAQEPMVNLGLQTAQRLLYFLPNYFAHNE
jgi:hypothetical protein